MHEEMEVAPDQIHLRDLIFGDPEREVRGIAPTDHLGGKTLHFRNPNHEMQLNPDRKIWIKRPVG